MAAKQLDGCLIILFSNLMPFEIPFKYHSTFTWPP